MRIVPNRSDDKLRIELPIGEMRIAEDIGGKVYIASREYKITFTKRRLNDRLHKYNE